jgi:hypothetical protein
MSFPFSFSTLCLIHACINAFLGMAVLYNVDMLSNVLHGEKYTKELFGGDKKGPQDSVKAALRVSESLVGFLMVDVGILIGIISRIKDKELQNLTCVAAVSVHFAFIIWRLLILRRIEAIRHEIPKQIASDIIMASTWLAFLIYN